MHNIIENSPEEKRRMLLQQLQIKTGGIDNTHPLSLFQEGLLFLSRLHPESCQYNMPHLIQLQGQLDSAALERSLNDIVHRHEALRTLFLTIAEKPMQVVQPFQTYPLNSVAIHAGTRPERLDRAHALVQIESRKPFNLEQGPLYRFTLLRIDEQEHWLLFVVHHIVFDLLSFDIFFKELGTLYTSFTKGEESPLANVTFTYGNYARWQQRQHLEEHTDYWKKQLQGPLPVLDFPVDHKRSEQQTDQGAIYSLNVPKELIEQVKAINHHEGSTSFMTLLTAFTVLLHRYTQQEDILVGTPCTNRESSEMAPLIGLLINTIVIRTDLSGEPSFRTLLQRVKETALTAYTHQQAPFSKVVEVVQPERDTKRTPIFQVMFALEEEWPELHVPNLTLRLLDNHHGTAKFDITFTVQERRDGATIRIEYNTDLLHEESIVQLGQHFTQILRSSLETPDQPIGQIEFLSPNEKEHILSRIKQSQPISAPLDTLHHLFEQQAAQQPSAIAISYEDQHLSYRELNEQANQLAHVLLTYGVEPGSFVGVALERSLVLPVALLAILKAGAAYVPYDPSYPTERIALMMDDSKPTLVITQSHLHKILPETQAHYLLLDTDTRIQNASPHNLESKVDIHQPAYMIYTSGSTGKPKGVIVSHANVVRLFTQTEAWYHFRPTDVWTLFHSYAFDFSVWELWGALLYGGRLVIVSYITSRSTEEFVELLINEHITVLNQTPSAFFQVIQAQIAHPEKRLPALRYIIFGGEALDLSSLRPWIALYTDKQPQLINMYGITETTVHVTYRLLSEADIVANRGSLIGQAIPDLQLYVLDHYQHLIPDRIIGELYVGGAGLAHGYWQRPDVTGTRFIHNPFSTEPQARLYRTGDLVRYHTDGELEYMGRIDQQVKIRGFRIELGEIEAQLAQLPTIQKAVVIVREDTPGTKRLVAYIQSAEGHTIHVPTLRNQLASVLPDHMLPAAFVTLTAWPLNGNGKLDQRALPLPDNQNLDSTDTYSAPGTPLEHMLADIWTNLLHLEHVGINDNFFSLGGDSILSLQVIARARAQGIHIEARQLFEHQTIATLASVARIDPTKTQRIEEEVINGTVPLTPIQERFFAQERHNPHHFNQATLLTLRAPLQLAPLKEAFQALAQHHDMLRARFQRTATGWQQQIVLPPVTVPVFEHHIKDQSSAEQKAHFLRIASALQSELNLSSGPLMQAALMHTSSHESKLLIVIHHLVIDGVSWRILLEDLQIAYQQLTISQINQQPVQLAEKTTSFKLWAQHLEAYAQSEKLLQEQTYWQQIMQKPVTLLPGQQPKGNDWGSTASEDTVTTRLDKKLTLDLLHQVPAAYQIQMNDILLTALWQTVSSWAQTDCVFIDLEGHGREAIFEQVDVSRTIGWFTSIFPVMLQVENNADPGKMLRSIKEHLRRIPVHGLGFGVLRYLSKQQQSQQLQSMEQAAICFNYLGQLDQMYEKESLFSPAHEDIGPFQDMRETRTHLLEINAQVVNEQLHIDWIFSQEKHQHADIVALAECYEKNLKSLIQYCLSSQEQGYTTSDFPLANLNEAQLQAIMARVGKQNK